jgi:hypothetical protein
MKQVNYFLIGSKGHYMPTIHGEPHFKDQESCIGQMEYILSAILGAQHWVTRK